MKDRTSLTARRRRASVLSAAVVGVLLGGACGAIYVGSLHDNQYRQGVAQTSPPLPEQLVAAHDCWTGPAPADMAGKFPGHVVAARGNHKPVYSARLVGPALDQVFGKADSGLTVYAFCR